MNPKPTVDAFVHLWGQLDADERVMLLDQRMLSRVRRLLQRAVRRMAANIFATPLNDEEAVHLLVKLKGMVRKEALGLVATWRRLAAELGYTGPIAWKVREGFTLKGHGPKAGPCAVGWKDLQSWNLKKDKPTIASIVFWIPRILPGSFSKTTNSQRTLLWEVQTRFGLPAHHLDSFGDAALLTVLTHAYMQRIGERAPINEYFIRTDTIRGDGNRLSLFWKENELHCVGLHDDADAIVGVFALGVEPIGS